MNICAFTGNLGKDPEFLQIGEDKISACKFEIAVQRPPKKDGTKDVDFITIVTWRGLADNCHKYLKKGSKVGVVGSLQIRSYEDKDGNKRKAAEIVADKVDFLSPKKDDTNGEQDSGTGTHAPVNAEQVEMRPIEDDSLPF